MTRFAEAEVGYSEMFDLFGHHVEGEITAVDTEAETVTFRYQEPGRIWTLTTTWKAWDEKGFRADREASLMKRASKQFALMVNAPIHRPVDDQIMPCEHDARAIITLIRDISRRHGCPFDLALGGAGDEGEYLLGILDVLLSWGIIAFHQKALLAVTGSATKKEDL